jgi:hypothetical protein
MFSYPSPEQRVPADHPLRKIRKVVDEVLKEMSPQFGKLYSDVGQPSIAPERLLRALLLQIFYSVRSERLMMEQLDYNLLFRWFVGMSMDEAVWVPTVFTKNRDRLLKHSVGSGCQVVPQEQWQRGAAELSGPHAGGESQRPDCGDLSDAGQRECRAGRGAGDAV